MVSYLMSRSGTVQARTNARQAGPLFVCLLGLLQLPADAVMPTIWREDSRASFIKGEAENVSITHDGVVTLGPSLKQVVDTDEEFVWALAEGKKGRLYIATGNRGKIFAYDEGKGVSELMFDSPEVAIFYE